MSALASPKQMMSRCTSTHVVLHTAQYCLLIAGFIFFMSFIPSISGRSTPASEIDPHTLAAMETVDAETDSVASSGAAESFADASAGEVKAAEAFPSYMNGALRYVSQRYKVSAEALRPIFETAHQVGREKHIDPLLIVAIIGIESSFNPLAESSFGAQGLMQVVPRFHQDKVPEGAGGQVFFDPVANIRIGTLVLQEAIERRGGLMAGLQHYAGSTDGSSWYADRVLAEKARLEQAIKRRSGKQQSA